jgi:uncharacterized protein YjbI with pentapeptide repeats
MVSNKTSDVVSLIAVVFSIALFGAIVYQAPWSISESVVADLPSDGLVCSTGPPTLNSNSSIVGMGSASNSIWPLPTPSTYPSHLIIGAQSGRPTTVNLWERLYKYERLDGGNFDNSDIHDSAGVYALTQRTLRYGSLSYCNMAGCDLRLSNFEKTSFCGTTFVGSDLVGVVFAYCNLATADFTNARLIDAQLQYATLVSTKMNNADLTGVTLTGANCIGVDFRGAIFDPASEKARGASFIRCTMPDGVYYGDYWTQKLMDGEKDLHGIWIQGLNPYLYGGSARKMRNIGGATFVSFDARGVNFNHAYLPRADLTGFDLTEASFFETCLMDANLGKVEGWGSNYIVDLSRADLTKVDLRRAKLDYAILVGADLKNANLMDASLKNADLTGVKNLYYARLWNTVMPNGTVVTKVRCSDGSGVDAPSVRAGDPDQRCADLYAANLAHSDLAKCDFRYSNLQRAQLVGCQLNGVQFDYATMMDAQLQAAKLNGARLVGADLTRANFQEADLTGADLTGAKLAGARFYLTNLSNANLKGADLSGVLYFDRAIFSNTIMPDGSIRNK